MSNLQATPDTEAIWRTLSDRLRQFVRSRVASTADVDDILQNVFLRIHENLDSLQQAERLESWVFQIARNVITDHYRKKTAWPLDTEALSALNPERTPGNLNSEVGNCLDELIEHLPEQLRRAVSMYEREGVSQKEIAERESISLPGAKSRVQRGRKLLKEMLQQCCQLQLDRYGNVLAWDTPADCSPDGEPCRCA